MFWLVLVGTLSIYLNVEFMSHGVWGLNRTFASGFSTNALLARYTPSLNTSLIIFNIGYGIMYFLKRETNFKLSMLQLALIVLYIFPGTGFYAFSILSWLVFLLNLAYSKK